MATTSATFVFFLGALLTALAINTSRLRRRFGRDLDADAKESIRRASRTHGNTLEHGVVFALLLYFSELQAVSPTLLKVVAALFIIARLAYAFGYYRRPVSVPMQIGAGLTYALEILLLNLLGAALFF